jgi:hypothetical protein
MNLQDYRKRKFRTIKAFAMAYGCSPSKAGMLLNGRYHLTLSKEEVVKIAALLGIPFETCVEACNESYAQHMGYKGDTWRHRKRRYKGRFHEELHARWQYVDDLLKGAEQARKSGDWASWHKTYSDFDEGHKEQQSSNGSPQQQWKGSPLNCFTLLDLPMTATPEQIKAAFRAKVKQSADGKGGYKGDMDTLVNAKEVALKYVESRKG